MDSSAVELEITELRLILPASLMPETPPPLTARPSSISSHLAIQTLAIKLTKPQALIKPAVLAHLSLPAALDFAQPVVLFGQAPIWLYSHLIAQCLAQSTRIPWIGTYDARGKRVVVLASHTKDIAVGDELPAALNRYPCPAILVGGPPDSGKSVFSNALRVALKQRFPNKSIYLHRASWDGEGNWVYEAGQPEAESTDFIKRLVTFNEFRIHEDPETAKLIPGYFKYHAGSVENLRQLTDCLIVDVGGLPQLEKRPLVERCSHYVVISRWPDAVAAWHQLCDSALNPLAVIHSVLQTQQQAINTEPLEIVAGPWLNAQNAVIPEILIERIARLMNCADEL